MTCPKCKAVDKFEGPRVAEGWQHFKCVCGTISFLNAYKDTPPDPLNWCGEPEKHWNEGKPTDRIVKPSERKW